MAASSPRDAIAVVPDGVEAAEIFRAYVDLLWAERELVEELLYRLVTQEAILRRDVSSDEMRWVGLADTEIRAALRRVEEGEILRAGETDALARRYGLAADASLLDIAAVAPAPWSAILLDHHQALSELTGRIDIMALAVAELADARSVELETADER